MRNRTKTASTNVLVVFGGDRDSHALAADFSKIGKKIHIRRLQRSLFLEPEFERSNEGHWRADRFRS